jgi:hypothetical protein
MRRAAGSVILAVAILGASGGTAATANPYTPSGTIVAESGFRPDTNGYSFPNYGNEGGPQNLSAASMLKLFGAGVCAGAVEGDTCTLSPPADAWREAQNKGMGGGHCEGFAITSSFFYAGVGDPSTPTPLGADTVPGLSGTSPAVQENIARAFVLQFLPALSTTKVNGSPAGVLAALGAGLASREPMVLGVYQRGFKGGHAITPLAIEDRGGGNFAVLVYDNNFPNTIREVGIDLNANTWNYVASTNPSEAAALYEGDADSKTLEVEYARNGLGIQPCPFCGGGVSARPARRGVPTGTDQQGQLIWQVDPRDGQHSDVSITDGDGNVAGITGNGDDAQITTEIPGVEVVPTKLGGDTGVDVWNQSAPPVFDVPSDLSFQANLGANGLEGSDNEGFTLVRDGVTFTLDDLRMEDGDDQQVEIGDKTIAMDNGADHEVSPTLSYDAITGAAGYEVTLKTSGLDADSTFDLTAKPGQHKLKLDFEGGDDDEAKVTAVVSRTDASGGVDKAHTKATTIDGGEDGSVSYGDRALSDGRLQLKL